MLRAMVFDFDGVIVDSEPLHHAAFVRVLFEPLGLDCDYDRYVQQYIGCDDRDAIRQAYAQAGRALDDAALSALIDRKAAAFAQVVAGGVAPIDGAVELIDAAAGRMPLAVASGALRSDIELILPAIADGRLADRFAAMVTADDVERSKPDPATYLLAARRLAIEPARCLAIEDTPAGLAAARAAGMMTLAVATTHPPGQLEADRTVARPADVSVDQLVQWFD
jgi:beta-phosphoglucomutase